MVNWELVISVSISLLIPTGIYIYGRIKTRQRVAQTLITEIEKNSTNCSGLRPHLIQAGIVPGNPQSGREKMVQSEPIEYDPGLVPPGSRFTTVALHSAATELNRFNKNTSEEVINYYRDVEFVKDLIDSIHEGRELPPAAYNILKSRFDRLETKTDELVSKIEIEKRWFPRIYHLCVRIQKFREI